MELSIVIVKVTVPPGATVKLKEAVGHLSDMATSMMTAGLPEAIDADAEIAAAAAQVDGLR